MSEIIVSLRKSFLSFAVFLCIEISCFSVANAAGNSNTLPTLPQISRAFSQGKSVSSVVLSASAEWIAGSDDETGTATLTASADGSLSMQLQLPKKSRLETQTSFSSGQSCAWTGADGVDHATPLHNCIGSMAWFLPSIALLGNQQPTAVTTAIAQVENSPFVDVLQQQQPQAGTSASLTTLLTHLSTSHLYLDPVTFLPSALSFNTHPDDNSGVDIPVHVVFTNYQQVNGVMIPYRIQRYVNGSLNLDLTVTQASVN
jgi:hypothetical protein